MKSLFHLFQIIFDSPHSQSTNQYGIEWKEFESIYLTSSGEANQIVLATIFYLQVFPIKLSCLRNL